MSAEPFLHDSKWISGPTFLMQPEKEWLANPDNLHEVPNEDPEVKVFAAIKIRFLYCLSMGKFTLLQQRSG